MLTFATAGCSLLKSDKDEGGENAFSVPADILFVVDNSGSTAQYSAAILEHFPAFMDTLQNGNPSVEFNIAFTTTTVDTLGGFTIGADPGEAGLFAGDVPVVGHQDGDSPAHQSMQNLGCWASCWNGYEMPTDATYTGVAGDCPFPADGVATTQYVDCLCNDVNYPEGENWDSGELCGSGNEMPVEAALLAMCRMVDVPPEVCSHEGSAFQDEWIGSNDGWLRNNTPKHIVLVTDEGDSSEISVGGLYGNAEDEPEVYLEAFAEFGRDITFSAIGPTLDCDGAGNCETTCSNALYPPSRTGSMRLKNLAEASGGLYLGITQLGESGDGGDSCPTANFGDHLEALANLFAGN